MPTMNVSRCIDINAPLDTVLPLLLRFEHWPAWSPWLCQEPEAEVTFTGPQGEVGSGYSWSGHRVGAGSMALRNASDTHINCDLYFLKPFKSQASVAFDLERLSDDKCRVQWSMQSSLPFFMFFMRKSFEAYIGTDYNRGLSMLKELAETGDVKSRVSIEAITDLPETEYIALAGSGKLADLGAIMQRNYPKLETIVATSGLTQNGSAFCHYRVMDPVNDHWEFIVALPISGEAATPGFERGTRPAIKRCAHIRHTGHYTHLGNAWATAFGWMRTEKHRHKKKRGGFEMYLDKPDQTDPAHLRTDLYIPLR